MAEASQILTDISLDPVKVFCGTKSKKPAKKRILRTSEERVPTKDPIENALSAGLRYVRDTIPGILRKKSGKGFQYKSSDRVSICPAELKRIKALAIPPAWTDVWICPKPEGHLQATGRDSKGRKQYKYHARWREVRDSTKFHRMIAFGQSLPFIRDQVEKDLETPGLPREKVLATIVRLLEITLIRVGNEEYARANNSYGLTTMRNHHLKVFGAQIRFQFRGKSGKNHSVGIKSKRLARILKKCQEIPGQELFQYIDQTGQPATVDSADVNYYLRTLTNQDFTAKDFRTWAATILSFLALQTFPPYETEAEAKKQIKQSVEAVSQLLGNTPAICQKSYIHPLILKSHLDGSLTISEEPEIVKGLATEEMLVLSFLRKQSKVSEM